MKFLKKRWHSIPIGIITAVLLVCLLAGGAFAANGAFITQNQMITQEIVAPPINYGTITAPDLVIPDIQTGDSMYKLWEGAVVVNLENAGVGKYLHLELDPISANLYTDYRVTLTTAMGSCPDGSDPVYLVVVLSGDGAVWEVSQQLTVAGEYIFAETVHATAGSTVGRADVMVTISLEDGPVTP